MQTMCSTGELQLFGVSLITASFSKLKRSKHNLSFWNSYFVFLCIPSIFYGQFRQLTHHKSTLIQKKTQEKIIKIDAQKYENDTKYFIHLNKKIL